MDKFFELLLVCMALVSLVVFEGGSVVHAEPINEVEESSLDEDSASDVCFRPKECQEEAVSNEDIFDSIYARLGTITHF